MIKDPDSRVDYAFDWGATYLDAQILVASSWSVTPDEPGGIIVAGSAHDTQRSSVTLTGGATGRSYRVTNHVTLSDGQVDDRSVILRVEQR